MVEVREAGSDEMTRWIRAPYRFYDDQPAHRPIPEGWLDELGSAEGEGILPDVSFYFALRDDEVVGRIAVFPKSGSDDVANFGFFEASPHDEDQSAIARALLERARQRADELGADVLEGPVSIFSIFSAGVMTSAFDETAPVYVDHARPEYAELLRALGPTDERLLRSWKWNADAWVPAAARQIADATRAHPGLSVRRVRTSNFERGDAQVIADLYNDAYFDSWDFRPLDARTVSWMLRKGEAIDPRCSTIVEIDGEPAALVVALPNINEVGLTAAEHATPWARFQERILQALKTPETVRVFIFCVRQAYRGRAVGGLATMMWHEFTERARDAGYRRGETPAVPGKDDHRAHSLRSIGLVPGRTFTQFTFEV